MSDSKPRESLTHEQWLEYVFARPVEYDRDEWYWQQDDHGKALAWWRPSPLETAEFLHSLCCNSRVLLGRYEAEQIAQGLHFVFGVASGAPYDEDDDDEPAWPTYCQRALSRRVPIELRLRWVAAIYDLYRDLFAPHCCDAFRLRRDPEFREDEGNDAHWFDDICFMLWDTSELCALACSAPNAYLADVIFESLEKILALPNTYCQAGALHGLGHLQPGYPHRVQALINRCATPDLLRHPNLIRYAEAARTGSIL